MASGSPVDSKWRLMPSTWKLFERELIEDIFFFAQPLAAIISLHMEHIGMHICVITFHNLSSEYNLSDVFLSHVSAYMTTRQF